VREPLASWRAAPLRAVAVAVAGEPAAAVAPEPALPSPAPAGEEETLAALAAGSEAALRSVYREHQEHVRAFARRLVGDDGSAEDLVQEVFVCLPRATRRFRGESSLRSFLISMAINHARHFVRAAARRRAATARYAREAPPARPQIEDRVERQQMADALVQALDSLPLDQRIAFILCEVEERTSTQAAALVGTSNGTLRARLHHAKRKLRARLLELGYGQEGAR
jgi:RNA polymerase sigma-70 factor (ECF subfamily)